ncbi:MAG: aconitate hydratase AcnA [Mariprofundaceae bacterium]|nr:aconitate hydratase AcnA [Mariprofundaceae bacterium]
MKNSFDSRTTLQVGQAEYSYYQLDKVADTTRLPVVLKVVLENLLRREDGEAVTRQQIEELAHWQSTQSSAQEIAYMPARVLMQDFTGVPAVVDLAAMRDALKGLGGDPSKINPLEPAEMVIDHSVQVDVFGSDDAQAANTSIEFERNEERYRFLKWGQQAFNNFSVVPPGMGIVHQVNMEHLARVVFEKDGVLYPDTLVGTDSHTTMVNGLGVLGWGVGGIEAEAAMLGQPVSMLVPPVVGFELTGKLPEGVTATDLVLTVVEMLRAHGVVGKFVEFHGSGLDALALEDRATLANMAPEYGATCGFFPIDQETLNYLALTGRSDEQIAIVEAYARAQGMFRDEDMLVADYSETLGLDMTEVKPVISGPKRPQDKIILAESKTKFVEDLADLRQQRGVEERAIASRDALGDGSVVIAAITSCTNTSNPSVMMAAGLLAQKAVAKGLKTKSWVKTSLGAGSKVAEQYLAEAGVMDPLRELGFHVVGHGCTTCIGNSGPLPAEVAQAIDEKDLTVCSVLSGNRNFEGRVHAQVRMNYLASPPLVVAYALAGNMHIDLCNEPLGYDDAGEAVYLKDVWPTQQEVTDAVREHVSKAQFIKAYDAVYQGDKAWQQLDVAASERYEWVENSTYVRYPPYFDGMPLEAPKEFVHIEQARVLVKLADSVTTDHISPAGAIQRNSPAARYLEANGVERKDFNSYGSRRGNHEVMMRGTFANIRLRNQLVAGSEGSVSAHFPSGDQASIYDVAMRYKEEGVPAMILAGKEYGSGSSRDWAAKGPCLLGVRAVIAESYERIHRSNLVGMGILPLQFKAGDSAESLGLDGSELFDFEALTTDSQSMQVTASNADGVKNTFTVQVRIDTPKEFEYYRHGGILHYVLRQLA